MTSGSLRWQGQQSAMGRPHDQVVNVSMHLYFVKIVSIFRIVCLYGQLDIQCPGKFLDVIGRDPSVSKSNRLHVDIFRFSLLI